ncbi:E3 ubiquitin-protein ligase ATL4 [Cajanus cajan]|uniref:RING-type E3 ubiquitin transferase n=1 Tax=Cajanus cajan TaxID=3821 RepID=A0A151UAB2_CAJCA|nr:E3 ubiquitin-protein ligase ATL4 [Cajanus cajan]KYP76266.1 E3 ubiquitin-protein ligase RNF181 [Cajanus cajan]
MVDIEERLDDSFCFRVRCEEPLKVKPRDILTFNVNVSVRPYTRDFSRLRPVMLLFESSVPITCESFVENNDHAFLRSALWPHPGYIPRSLDQLGRRIVLRIQQELEVQTNTSADSTSRQFSLALDIFIDTRQHSESDDEEDGMIEESMQQDVRMVPASKEAIESLKAFTDSSFLKTEKCNICMERFQDDVNSLSCLSMPCNHVFHSDCIVKWLQTSHMCPLCRYPMPIAKD